MTISQLSSLLSPLNNAIFNSYNSRYLAIFNRILLFTMLVKITKCVFGLNTKDGFDQNIFKNSPPVTLPPPPPLQNWYRHVLKRFFVDQCVCHKHEQYDKVITILLLCTIAFIKFQYCANTVGFYSVETQKYACYTNAVIRVTTSKISAVR